jgi:hypothetical protein
MRHGLTSECALESFGDTSTVKCGDDDNNGEYTSIIVAAEAYRFLATNDPAALDLLWQYVDGMRLLNDITGIKVRARRDAARDSERGA